MFEGVNLNTLLESRLFYILLPSIIKGQRGDFTHLLMVSYTCSVVVQFIYYSLC